MIPLRDARATAENLVARFTADGDCERVQIAGSIRRDKPHVKDIEIVAMPRVSVDLFGNATDERCGLDVLVDRLVDEGVLSKRMNAHGNPQAYGQRYKALFAHRPLLMGWMPLDLFVVRPPAQFGAVLAIRTGPADHSKMLVTKCQENGLRCVEGRLVFRDGSERRTDTEEDFYAACGVRWVAPHLREERRDV